MKKISIIFLIFCGFLLTVGVVSASDNSNNDVNINETSVNQTSVNESSVAVNSSQNSTVISNIKTSVSVPDTGFVYKKNSYMKITIKDKVTKHPVKNLKIKVKVYTGKKYKTYTLKTDENGVAKLYTKNFKMGTHKFIIKSANGMYNVTKKSYFFIGKKHTITLKINRHRKLKSGDVISTYVKKKYKDVYTDVWYGTSTSDIEPKYTMILKSKLFFKNKKTGSVKTKTAKGKLFVRNGQVKKSFPKYSLIKGYTPYKAKIWYLTSR